MRWIKLRRQELHITQDELATRLQLRGQNFTRGSVANWEQGRHSPPFDDSQFVAALADSLSMDVQTILRLSGYAVSGRYGEVAERIAGMIDKLPESEQRRFLRMVEAFVKAEA